MVYDVTQRETFDAVDRWINDLRNNTDERLVILLIGNKSDLEEKRLVKKEEGEEKAKEKDIAFLETSALTASNIDKAFNEMLNKVFVAFKPVEGENVEMEIEDKEMIDLNGVTRVEKQSCC